MTYGFRPGDDSDLRAAMSNPQSLHVYGLAGLLCVLAASPGSDIQTVKDLVAVATGVPAREQRLLDGTRELHVRDQLPPVLAAGSGGLTLFRRPKDEADWLDKMQEGGKGDLFGAPAAVRNDRSLVLAAVQRNGMALQHVAGKLRADREVVLAAVSNEGAALQFADVSLRADREVALAAVKQAGWALRHISAQLHADKEIALAAVQQAGWALGDVALALRAHPEIVEAALWQSKLAAEFLVPEQSEMAVDAENQDSPRSASPRAVRRCVRPNRSMPAAASASVADGAELETLSSDDRRAVLLSALSRCGMELRRGTPALKADRRLVLAAVEQEGGALQFASRELRADRGVVLAAVRQAGWSLQYASLALRADREVVLAAVQQSGWSLEFAAPLLRADRDIVLAAVRRDSLALRHAVMELQGDAELLMTANWRQRRV
ncbi:unnamed protein product [Polarella glacialis]|uniref:DUF4116 domain-containing protein n=1 Tax=Polarella glacialis TaxID=89957 RepID=A0A813K3L4_POLGL|nr:unnamed protein product [Polarella glacialis]